MPTTTAPAAAGIGNMDECSSHGTVTVEFVGTTAIVHMRCGENRLSPAFIDKMNSALDAVER